jgi:O-antigen ligase
MASGFSGRVQLWEIAIEAWREKPIGGIGYRVHEYYPGLELTAHNGYLALLMETGVLGALFVLLIVFSGLRELVTQVRQGSVIARIGLSLVIGYLFISFFERYLFNFGTPTSILMLMFLLIPSYRHRMPSHGRLGAPLFGGTAVSYLADGRIRLPQCADWR